MLALDLRKTENLDLEGLVVSFNGLSGLQANVKMSEIVLIVWRVLRLWQIERGLELKWLRIRSLSSQRNILQTEAIREADWLRKLNDHLIGVWVEGIAHNARGETAHILGSWTPSLTKIAWLDGALCRAPVSTLEIIIVTLIGAHIETVSSYLFTVPLWGILESKCSTFPAVPIII